MFQEKLKNIWNKINPFLSSILDKPISMSVLLGFVIGATLPTYALIASKKIQLGDVGEWLGAIATFFAVWVSLYLAREQRKAHLKIEVGNWNPFFYGEEVMFDIVNMGSSSDTVRICVDLDQKLNNDSDSESDSDFVSKYVEYYSTEDRLLVMRLLKYIVESSVMDKNHKIIKPLDDIVVHAHSRVSVFVEPEIIERWLQYNSPISGKVSIDFFVETMDGRILSKPVVKSSFLNQIDMWKMMHQPLPTETVKNKYLPVSYVSKNDEN